MAIEDDVMNLVAAQLAIVQMPPEWAGDDPAAYLCPSATVCTEWVIDAMQNAFAYVLQATEQTLCADKHRWVAPVLPEGPGRFRALVDVTGRVSAPAVFCAVCGVSAEA